MSSRLAGRERRRLRVTGVVQGVGFRPFVHRLANDLGLRGFVGNDPAGVFAEIEGTSPELEEFAARLRAEAPPLARVDSIDVELLDRSGSDDGSTGFVIVESSLVGAKRTLVPPDVSVCDECMDEVLDPNDRRHRYPFTNCTNCGPRFTIIRDLPYDRSATTMAGFALCDDCATEYSDPGDRRYHAQPLACPECGPTLAFERDGSVLGRGTDPVLAAVQDSIAALEVVAIKGIGGYHLACDAVRDHAVARLRERKGRSDKPFAVMVPDLETAATLGDIGPPEADALMSPARPIVLLRCRDGAPLSSLVTPGNPLIGVMLPYTPLHHLLFRPVPGHYGEPPRVLVLTSGNLSDEPICFDDDEARARLGGIADAFCTHDRPIQVPCDDSVVRIVDAEVMPIRRSRGYAPLPVSLPVELRPTLAVGGDLKNAFCLAAGERAWISQHIGDMENLETLAAFGAGVDGFVRMYDVEPERFAVDRHPGYLTRLWAGDRQPTGEIPIEVQHHHAHVASVMVEHGLDGSSPVIGVAFDGTGFGASSDGSPQIWGGEILVADYRGFARVGHLRPLPLPGGDEAVRNPCRIAVAYLRSIDGIELDPAIPAVGACDDVELGVVTRQVDRGVGCVPTTSMGRLFDAVASMIGLRHRISYEAQAAIELEALAETGRPGTWPLAFTLDDRGTIDPAPVLRRLVDGLAAGVPVADLARAFHDAVVDAIVGAVVRADRHRDLATVALTGGVFQNALLSSNTRKALTDAGYEVLTHRLVPPNDGGLALGQAVIAGFDPRPDPSPERS